MNTLSAPIWAWVCSFLGNYYRPTNQPTDRRDLREDNASNTKANANIEITELQV